MKICILAHTTNNKTGIGEFVDNLINEITKLVPDAKFTLLTSENLLRPNYFALLRNWFEIRSEIRKVDIIHAIDAYPYGAIAALANIFIGKPIIITAIGTGSIKLLNSTGWKLWLLKWTYRRSRNIIAISNYVKNKLEEYIQDIKVDVINLGVDCSYWSTVKDTYINIRLQAFQPYMLSVGELKKRKGYDVVLPMLPAVFKDNPELKYVIVANTNRNLPHKEILTKIIKMYELEDRVMFLSNLNRDDLRNVFQHASVYVSLPQDVGGDIEGFGLAIIQAAAGGVPAIIGRGSGADDAVMHGVSGYLIDNNNKDAFIKTLRELLKDNSIRNKYSEGAKKFAQKLHWPEMVKPYVSIYQKLSK